MFLCVGYVINVIIGLYIVELKLNNMQFFICVRIL